MMHQKSKYSKNAFSLVELSIVILVIGILVAAITKGKDLYEDIKLTAARSITTSSSVSSIKGMVLWLETTMDKSFNNGSDNKSDITFDEVNNIEIWNDVNPSSAVKVKYTSSTSAKRPTVVRSGIAGLPSVEFDGVDDEMSSVAVIPRGSADYTVAIVWSSKSQAGTGTLWDQASNPVADKQRATYSISASAGDYNVGFAASSTQTINFANKAKNSRPTSSIIVMEGGTLTGYINGASNSQTLTDAVGLIIGDAASRIGSSLLTTNSSPFKGQIAEIIIFDKALKETDVREIEDYFSQKYSIKMAQ